jgi:hypothetical protein
MTTGEIVFRSAWWINQQPLKEFVEKKWQSYNKEKWVELFHKLPTAHFS